MSITILKGYGQQTLSVYVNTDKIDSDTYRLLTTNCVNKVSSGLNRSGVFNVGIHPYILQTQMVLRSIGARPTLFSYLLIQKQ